VVVVVVVVVVGCRSAFVRVCKQRTGKRQRETVISEQTTDDKLKAKLTSAASGNNNKTIKIRCKTPTVDFVHGALHVVVGVEINHQRVHYFVAVLRHGERQLVLDGVGNVVLGGEGLVQLHARHGAADHVEHVGHNLTLVVGELVVGAGHLVLHYSVLYCGLTQTYDHTKRSEEKKKCNDM
jgi:hypothetical protein